MAERFNPPEIWQPFGAFSMARAQGDGHVLHLKGQIPLDRNGNLVGTGDMRAQVEQTLANIRAVLAHAGGEMGDILSLIHYTTDIEAFMQCGDIRARFFQEPYPVTTTVQVAPAFFRNASTSACDIGCTDVVAKRSAAASPV